MALLTFTVVPHALTAKNWACSPEPSAARFAVLLERALGGELQSLGLSVQVVVEVQGRMRWSLEGASDEQRLGAEALVDAIANAVRDTGDWVVFDDAY